METRTKTYGGFTVVQEGVARGGNVQQSVIQKIAPRQAVTQRSAAQDGFVQNEFNPNDFVQRGTIQDNHIQGGFVRENFAQGGFIQGNFVQGGIVEHNFVQGGFVQGQAGIEHVFDPNYGYNGPGDMRTHLWNDHGDELRANGVSRAQLDSMSMELVQKWHNFFHGAEDRPQH